MTDPRELHVIGKKPEVADRTLNERKYCAIDDYYYSEMFTCPICYGADRERERIVELLKPNAEHDEEMCYLDGQRICWPEDCNAEIFAWTLQLILHERTNYKQT